MKTIAAFTTVVASNALLAACCATTLMAQPAPSPPATKADAPAISSGAKVDLKRFLKPESATVFLFFKSSSTLESDFAAALQSDIRRHAGESVGFHLIHLKTGAEPVASQHGITQTPSALIYDRRGRLVARSSDAAQIRAAIQKAARVPRIDWAEDGDPRLDAVRQMMGGRPIPGILRTMSLQPEYMRSFMEFGERVQFTDGFLDRRTKEMIGTYVSALNECRYCVGSHARGLQMQGANSTLVDALATLNIPQAKLEQKENALLNYVRVLTLEPSKVRDTHVARLRETGWNDEQIFEATMVTALFAFANRMANAYGLDYPTGGWIPPALRAGKTDATGTAEPATNGTTSGAK